MASILYSGLSREFCSFSAYGYPLTNSYTALPKAEKPVWANQLTRTPCLVATYVKFQFVYIATSRFGSQLLLAATSSNVLLRRGPEKVIDEGLGVNDVFLCGA